MKPVNTKADFVRRYQAGEFGNRSPTWDTFAEWCEATPGPHIGLQLYHVRNRVASGPTWYDVPADDVEGCWNRAINMGTRAEDLYISAMAPTEQTIIQGEVQRTSKGLYFHYSTEKLPMRDALAKRNHDAYAMVARQVLYSHMNTISYEWLEHLLDTYQNHIVELSVYEYNWGTVPGHNTVFWEVRNY